MATGMEEFVPLLVNRDTKMRLQLGSDMISYLENPINSVECEEMGYVVDSLASWLNSSNFKVAQNGLEILGLLADRLKEDFRHYLSTVLSATIDRLGDNKDTVREQAKIFIMKLMYLTSAQYMLEKLMPAFSHKNFRVREEVLNCLQDTLTRYGTQSLSLLKFMPLIAKLLSDSNSQVRDTAVTTLVEIYRHVGERVRHDLAKKYNIPQAKLQIIFSKFDELRNSGQMLPTALLDLGTPRAEDEVDRASSRSAKRASSAPPRGRAVFSPPKAPSAGPSTLTRKHSLKGASSKTSIATVAGAADEEMFIKSFEDVPRIQLYSAKELEVEMNRLRQTLADPNTDWEKRIESLKHFRSLLIAGAADYDEFYSYLRQLEQPFQVSVKDLRSQVVREACITVAYLSQQLGNKLDHFSEIILPSLINLIPSSAKIMSTAGIVAIRFIIQYTHVSRLIPIITYNLTSKSKDIRKTCSEFLDQLLHTWPTHTLEKHIATLQEAIKRGISDADPEARAFSRKAFWGFADHFKDQADSLLHSLDSSKQRMLQGELCMSNSSSSNSLNSAGKPFKHSSHAGSVENLARPGSSASIHAARSGIPIFASSTSSSARTVPATLRSNSAIDLGAVRRARARAFTTAQHLGRGSGASLPRPGSKRSDSVSSTSAVTSPERIGRSRTKGVSQSQPSSRSGSPSSRLGYATYHMQTDGSGRTRRRSGIPTAVCSHETSPERPPPGLHERRFSGSSRRQLIGAGERYTQPTIISQTPLLAERILQQSKEAEAAMADALVSWKAPPKKRYNAFDDQSDESETSSLCSDRSFSSYNRGYEDVPEIIHNLSSIHWSDRKEGLIGLLALLKSSRTLTFPELKRVTDILTKMFMDPHTKVFTLFLDTLNELIQVHSGDLHGWLYVLLTRLFIKMGTDLLGSVQAKIQKTLDLIRDSFPCSEQFHVVVKFSNDQTQTPNLKVKVAVLQFLLSLLQVMDPSEMTSTNHDTKAMIVKIVSWSGDTKSSELRKHSQEVVLALFKLKTAEMSLLVNQMTPEHQCSAMNLIQSRMRRCGSEDAEMRTPSPVMTHIQSPITSLPRLKSRSSTPLSRSFDYDDTENLNPEDLYNSIRKTTAEIQKFSLDKGDQDVCGRQRLGDQDMNKDQIHMEEERIDLTPSRNLSPVKSSPYEYVQDGEIISKRIFSRSIYDGDHTLKPEQDTLQSIFTTLNNNNTRNEQKKEALNDLITLTKEASSEVWDENFRNVLCILVDIMDCTDISVRVLALRALCELIKRQPQQFNNFVELTLIKILKAFKDQEREIHKAAESCSMAAAVALPPEQSVRILKSLITSEEQDVIIAAIKMMSRLVEYHPKNIIKQLIPEMMPALLKAYDHTESPVRKAAVFCMVSVHGVVGAEAMKPHLESLKGCKLKLLNLYIKRSQTQSNSGSSTPNSPSNTASSSSNP